MPDTVRFRPCWVLLGAILLPCIYLPTLATRFDFIDDGNLVYPSPPMALAPRLELVWDKIVANYEHLGPFRPVLWCHWEVEAELFHGDPVKWRLARFAWCGLAAGMLLWLLRELRIPLAGALPAAALAMWNPFRNEIWTSLTLAEGVAMPYALLALVAAERAGRSPRPWMWDIVGALGVLAALGCKNVFAALVPVQIFLRIAPDGVLSWELLRRHGRRAALLSLTLLLPMAHFVYFEMNWHPGQYRPSGPSMAQAKRIVRGLLGAESLDFVGVGLALAAVAVAIGTEYGVRSTKYGVRSTRSMEQRPSTFVLCTSYSVLRTPFPRVAVGTGALLLVGGVVMYLPMDAISGRYTMPAVWGLDLLIAALLGALAAMPAGWLKRLAWTALAAGLITVAVANVGRQEKFAARADLLWQALECVEQTAPPGTRIGWLASSVPAAVRTTPDQLNIEEGIHFQWHLAHRGRGDLHIGLCDEQGRPQQRCELPTLDGPPELLLSGPTETPPGWQPVERFRSAYWGGRRHFDCVLWALIR